MSSNVYKSTKDGENTGSSGEVQQAVKLTLPDLPVTVQGDGRYLMSLLKPFLEETAKQVNLANGFDQEEIDDQPEGAVQTPRNFRLTFTRLGGEFTWDHIYDIENLAFYELRTDVYVGEEVGLLERTVNASSMIMPITSVGHVYLYAFNKDGEYSYPAEILYNKPRPDAPTDIAFTKTSEGTLITFSEIPSNCVGAYIYIDNKRYIASDNVYLLQGEIPGGAEQIEVSFYDQFGEGERGILYLVLPDVTGFLVERNGAELDFYWDAINIYNIKYIVKVCSELSWERGTELFRTATNDKNRRLYPNRGDYYLMVKAYDEHGNYSRNAAYMFMTNDTDISRNIILEFDQNDTLYAGAKINMYYDVAIEGITLDREAIRGEYIFPVSLDQRYKARNWLEYSVVSVTQRNSIQWQDANMMWQDANFQWAGVLGNVDSANVKQELAYKDDEYSNDVFGAMLDGELTTEDGEAPTLALHADEYMQGRWIDVGLLIKPLTKLEYAIDTGKMESEFNMAFSMKTLNGLLNTEFIVLEGENGSLTLGYDTYAKCFYLNGSDGTKISVPFEKMALLDCFSFAISQEAEARRLYVYSFSDDTVQYTEIAAAPIGIFNKLYCYAK